MRRNILCLFTLRICYLCSLVLTNEKLHNVNYFLYYRVPKVGIIATTAAISEGQKAKTSISFTNYLLISIFLVT